MIFEWLTLELILSFLAIGVSVWSVYQNKKDGLSQLAFERRLEVYSELSGYLQEVTADHDQAAKLRSKIYGLITKTYFFASQPINDLFQEFLDEKVYDKEIERVKTEGRKRNRSFNEFDAYIWTLIECMKYEAKERLDITAELKVKERAKQFTKIGSDQHTDVIVRTAKDTGARLNFPHSS